jgi:glycerol-3-phosphate dehydrogenase (NAD(P)+)
VATLSLFGAGSWGTALANVLANNGHDICLWCRRREQAEYINTNKMNPDYLKDIPLTQNIHATWDMEEAATRSSFWIMAIPTQSVREILSSLKNFNTPYSVCNVAKGIEIKTLKPISEIVKEFYPDALYAVLSGPSHAEEVIKGLPTATIVASSSFETAQSWQNLFNAPCFRVYTGNDVAGVEIGGAVKNVIAIASGIGKAMNLGDNATAALVSRGLAEIMRLGAKLGAHPLTLAGLAGIGDLVVTCYSFHSRNFRLGKLLGEGKSLDEAKQILGQVAEGAFTVRAVIDLAKEHHVELPIAEAIYRLLYEGTSPRDELENLLTRDPKPEYPPAIFWS